MINKPCKYILNGGSTLRGILLAIGTDFRQFADGDIALFPVGIIQTESGKLISIPIENIEILK